MLVERNVIQARQRVLYWCFLREAAYSADGVDRSWRNSILIEVRHGLIHIHIQQDSMARSVAGIVFFVVGVRRLRVVRSVGRPRTARFEGRESAVFPDLVLVQISGILLPAMDS